MIKIINNTNNKNNKNNKISQEWDLNPRPSRYKRVIKYSQQACPWSDFTEGENWEMFALGNSDATSCAEGLSLVIIHLQMMLQIADAQTVTIQKVILKIAVHHLIVIHILLQVTYY
jgi:hypothetical protein